MRRSLTLQIFFILFLMMAHRAASGQGDYVVTIKGDTLRGKVKYFMYTGVQFAGTGSKYVQLTPENGKKSTHEILQTISFRMNDEIYHTIKLFDRYTFMKLIRRGYLSLYAYQMENQTTWDGRYFVKKDGTLLDVPNIGFKKRVGNFLADCPTVVKDVESGLLGKSDLLKLVDQYNVCTETKVNPPVAKKNPAVEAWVNLGTEVDALSHFDKKSDALEMIREVQNKLSKNESVPAFLVNGIKDALKEQESLKSKLDEALALLPK